MAARARLVVASSVLLAAPLLASPALGQTAVRKVRLVDPPASGEVIWRLLAREESGDGSSSRLPDATALSYAIVGSMVWFRVDLAAEPDPRWLGVNVAVDSDLDTTNGTPWWGSNSEFAFDRLLTAYLNRGDGYWQGMVGLADAEGAGRGEIDSITHEVKVGVDRERPAIVLGVERRLLDDDGHYRLVATVGSSFLNNDDVPNTGAAEVEPDPGS